MTNKRTLTDWIMATRPWSYPASTMPVALVLAYYFANGVAIDPVNAVWALVNIVIFHAAGNVWSDYFDFRRWLDAFAENGFDPEFYAVRERAEDECLPWGRINMGVRTSLLLRERHRAYDAQLSPDCRAACSACGAAALLPKGVKCDG